MGLAVNYILELGLRGHHKIVEQVQVDYMIVEQARKLEQQV